MFSPKKFSWCFALALAACASKSNSDNDGGKGGEGDGGTSGSSGGQSGGNGEGGKSEAGSSGQAGKVGSNAGGTGGVANQGGSPNQGGNGNVPVTRPNIVNKATCAPPALKLTSVGKAASPMQVTQGKGDDFLMVAERSGKIQRLKDGKLEGLFANFEPSVRVAGDDTTSERGLLGLALHPDYENNGRFFIFYNRRENDPYSQGKSSDGKSADIVIAEGKRAADKTKAETTLKTLVVIAALGDHHIGGFLAFGRDGYLYAGLGDGGGDDQVRGVRSRAFGDLGAKILRIDINAPTRKVEGNLEKTGAAPQVWVYGVRNPFRGSFDSATGDLYLGDVGEFSYEEINYVEFGKTPDPDFGWYLSKTPADEMQGQCNNGGATQAHQVQTGMEGEAPVPYYAVFAGKKFGHLPIKTIKHDGGGEMTNACSWMGQGFACSGGNNSACSRAIIGGVVYRGKKIPDLDGRYIYGEHVKNTVDSFIVKNGAVDSACEASLTATLRAAGTPLMGITSFGTDKDGEVYITDLAGGNIYRIDPK